MSYSVTLQRQLIDIMEVLAKAAVADICKLFDEESAVLRWEMSRSQYENDALNKKLLHMERELRTARGHGTEGVRKMSVSLSTEVQTGDETQVEQGVEHSPAINCVSGKEFCVNLWRDGVPIVHEPDDDSPLQSVTRAESTEERPDLFLIKEEKFEEDLGNSDSRSGMEISGETVSEPDAIAVEGSHTEHQHCEDECDSHSTTSEGPEEQDTYPIPTVTTAEAENEGNQEIDLE
ncbi:hypothetical protein AAFF_G00419310 [Aldrovandia affinis]|uniref:Uncharacterized protein n=1 Tax=Aldrovandia affinis TaxID=143900 RepID=A0AAD7SA10_9TELE|nr:hypothetical protein AAFF_G00419310 [Aldrovandia affinis]